MKKINIIYRKWLFRNINKSVNVPERWNELTAAQFIAAVRLWMGEITDDSFISAIFSLSRSTVRMLTDYQRFTLIHLVDFLNNTKSPHNSFFISSLSQYGCGPFLSPGPRLKGCTLQQFMTADTFFQQFALNQDQPKLLDMFVASLYMTKNQRYVDIEIGLNKSLRLLDLDENISLQCHLDHDTKYAIFLNFLLIKSWLSKAYPFLFPTADDDDDYSNRPKPAPVNWLEIFDSFVGDNVPDMKKYQAMPATDAFRIMNRRIKEAKKNAK
jgi:hypothetical protein